MRRKCQNLKPLHGLMLVTLIALFFLTPSVEAGTWRDDFDDDNLNGWTLRNPHSAWFFFRDTIWARVRAPGLPLTVDFLEFTAFPGPFDKFTVTLAQPSSIMHIGLGKMFPETGSQSIFFYGFYPNHISASQVLPTGGVAGAGFRGWLPRNPGTIWEGKPLELAVHFDAGRFRFFADGQLRADFEDDHFDQIEFIMVMIVGEDGAQGQVDAFEISGPGIGGLVVQAKGKLATMWGSLRKR